MGSHRHLMIAIDWFGPYRTLNEAHSAASVDYDHGLYMVIGKQPEEQKKSPQYIGIANNLRNRLTQQHHKISRITGPIEIWLGEVVTAEPSGKKVKSTKTTLDYSEWLHARFLSLPLNDRKSKTLPNRSATVLNRWWNTNYETARLRRPHPSWPDLIDFQLDGLPARTVWFGGRQRRFLAPDYAKL
ncbi:hypothetical protein [Enterovirga rhinocerotis]|uniref:hypothetical protein n=1 Tax=Enterovirga rhinocerotis TaxID=1339210 RepID=UPI00105CB0DC|nr:hypothetical protein [Enterovirga rhinocerotis]